MPKDLQQKSTRWKVSQRQFIEWLALPRELKGDIRTEAQFAESIGMERTALWKWKKLPGFWQEVQEATRPYLGHRLAEILETMQEQAARGNYQHAMAVLAMTGYYTPTTNVNQTGDITIKVVYADPNADNTDPA